ncbi:MAG: M28 family peptidase [Candidatus Heimdallarchaeota archaeon]
MNRQVITKRSVTELTAGKIVPELENLLAIVQELMKYENRIAGTEQIKNASRYISEFLNSFTEIKVWIDQFPIYTSFPISSDLSILTPVKKNLNSFPNGYSRSSPPEGITGELVYVGSGSSADYENKDVRGKIILADLSYAPPRPEKAGIALDKGVNAMILSNWGQKDNQIVGRGAIKHRWGPLVPEDVSLIPRIASINIARKDAEELKSILKMQQVTCNLKCKVEEKWVTSHQPTCRISPTHPKYDEVLVVGAHLEAWGGTVTDNSTGNAIVMEIARALSDTRDKINREVIMSFWDGHEIGEAAGSGWFVDHYWPELSDRGLGYINIDGCGMIGTSDFVSYSSPETWSFLDEIEKGFLGTPSTKKLPLKIGDNSFLGIGIPYIFTFATYPQQELERLGNAIFGWWYHSEEDTWDKLDPELLDLHAQLYYEYVLRLVTIPVVPWNYEAYTSYLIKDVELVKKRYPEHPFPDLLSLVKRKLKTLLEKTIELNELVSPLSMDGLSDITAKEKKLISVVNKIILRLGRILNPAFRSVSGKYRHDPYGFSDLALPLPRVTSILNQITTLEPTDEQNSSLLFQLRREYNTLYEAISNAIYLIESAV